MKRIKKDKTFTVRISTELLKDFDKAIKACNDKAAYTYTSRNALVVGLIRKWVTLPRDIC